MATSPPSPPVFIVELNGDVDAFDSVEGAEGWVESVDVEDGEYPAAYDSAGRILALEVERPTKRGLFSIQLTPVRLRALEETPTHEPELRRVLIDALRVQGTQVDKAIPLLELVALSLRVLRR
ncbi:MAG: hypothetical protein QM765_43080 [Myxococcales bacterium]